MLYFVLVYNIKHSTVPATYAHTHTHTSTDGSQHVFRSPAVITFTIIIIALVNTIIHIVVLSPHHHSLLGVQLTLPVFLSFFFLFFPTHSI